jgi:hypothetical protein
MSKRMNWEGAAKKEAVGGFRKRATTKQKDLIMKLTRELVLGTPILPEYRDEASAEIDRLLGIKRGEPSGEEAAHLRSIGDEAA